jgi:hypothetical protein
MGLLVLGQMLVNYSMIMAAAWLDFIAASYKYAAW